MSTTKLVTVFGATGLQGGSVVRSLISNKDREFSVRGITRNPDSEKSKALAALGVEMVKAEGSNLEEIKQAFRGSWAVFLNTDTESAVSQATTTLTVQTDGISYLTGSQYSWWSHRE